MQCRFPPPLTDEELSQVLDGIADPHVLAHVTQCASCAARLKVFEEFEVDLKKRLFRLDCADPNELGEYYLGLVHDERAQAIKEHLTHCPHCQAELDEIQTFLRDGVARPAQPRKSTSSDKGPPVARRNWRQLIAVLMPPSPQPVLRGNASDDHIIRAQTEDGTIVRLAARVEDDMVTVRGQIIGDPVIWVGALVEVRQAEQLLVVTAISESGQFRFESAPIDKLNLKIIAEKGLVIRVENVSLADLA